MFLPSCSLLFDAADVGIRQTKALEKGETVSGDGFGIRVPEAGLYSASFGKPIGAIALRPTEPFLEPV